MKKVLLLPFLLFMVIASHAENSNAKLFEIDEEEISAQFSELSKLEDYVTSHQGITLAEVMNAASEEQLHLDANMLNNFATTFADGPANLPSFLWGCLLGPIGIAIVYVVTEDNDETKKALYGCLTQGAVWVLYVAASYIFAFGVY